MYHGIVLVTHTKSSRERGCAPLAAAFFYKKGRQERGWVHSDGIRSRMLRIARYPAATPWLCPVAAPLAASRQRTRCRDRTQPQRNSRILRDS